MATEWPPRAAAVHRGADSPDLAHDVRNDQATVYLVFFLWDAGSGMASHLSPLPAPFLNFSLSLSLSQTAIQISMMTTSMPLPSPPSYLKVHMPSFFSSQYAPVALCIPRRPTCGLPSVAVASVLVDT